MSSKEDEEAKEEAKEISKQEGSARPEESRWDDTTAENYAVWNPADHETIRAAIVKHLLPFSEGRVVDLGAGTGIFGRDLQDAAGDAATVINVDPFPPASPVMEVVKMGGVEWVAQQEDQSLDLVYSAFSVHLMDRASLDVELRRALRPGKSAIYFSVNPSSPWFGNEEFNKLFVSVGFERNGGGEAGANSPTTTLHIDRPMTYTHFHNFITKRCWSNLKVMPDDRLIRMAELIPADLAFVQLHIDVYEYRLENGSLIKMR